MNAERRRTSQPSTAGRWTRRRFALALPLLGALHHGAQGHAWAGEPSAPLLERASRPLMGTRVAIVAAAAHHGDAPALRSAMQQAFVEMERLEALLSRYRADSDVARLAAAAGRHPVAVAPEVMAVLHSAQRLHRDSGGAFDATVGALRAWRFEPGSQAVPQAANSKANTHEVAENLNVMCIPP